MRLFIAEFIVAFLLVYRAHAQEVWQEIEQGVRAAKVSEISRLYAERKYSPIWIGPGVLNSRAEEFIQLIRHIDEDGFDPETYRLASIEKLRAKSSNKDLVKLEILLSRSLLELLSDMRFGRSALRKTDSALDRGFTIDRATLEDIFNLAVRAPEISQYIKSLLPAHVQYQRMKLALAEYRTLVKNGGWSPVHSGPALKPGVLDTRISEIAQRLKVTGDLDPSYVPESYYEGELVDAVRYFQHRHGLLIDGVVGPETVRAMNITAEERLLTLLINIERWRWLSLDLGKRFLIVNIAGFELLVIEEGRPVFRTPVIVGKEYQMTPVFSEYIRAIEFNPYWNVPLSIASKEILPKLKKNSAYLAAQHMEVLPRAGRAQNRLDTDLIAWHRISSREMNQYAIRQLPGPWNALGGVKFIFPNQYEVYLHDTPSRDLFEKNFRAFSHGCIRVKDPLKLATMLLSAENPEWDEGKVAELIELGKNSRVKLKTPVPIHIIYRTAWVESDGTVNFRRDLYGRDSRIAKIMS